MLKGSLMLLAIMPVLAAELRIPSSPQPNWTVPVGIHRGKPPILYNGKLYFIVHNDFRNHLYFADAKTGAILWKSGLRATQVDLAPDDTLRVFTMDRYYLGLNPQTGKVFDSNDLLQQPNIYETSYRPLYLPYLTLITSPAGELVALTPAGEKWRAKTGWTAFVDMAPPVAYKGLVLIGAGHSTNRDHGGLKAYQLNTGALVWNAADVKDAAAVQIFGDVAVVYEGYWADPNTFAPSVRAVDAATGKLLWSLKFQDEHSGFAWAVEKAHAEGDVLILPCAAGVKGSVTLRGVDLHTGAQKFDFALESPSAEPPGFAFSGGVVYTAQGKQIVGIDPTSGKVVWRSATFASSPGTPVAGDGFVYAGDRQAVSGWAIR